MTTALLARVSSEGQRIKSLFHQHRVRVFTSSGQIDLDTIDGEFSADLMAILARRERQKIAERGRDHARDAGRWMGGVLPAPYVLRDGKIEVDADMRDQVLEMLDYLRTHTRAETSRQFRLGQGRVRNMVAPRRLWMYAGNRSTATASACLRHGHRLFRNHGYTKSPYAQHPVQPSARVAARNTYSQASGYSPAPIAAIAWAATQTAAPPGVRITVATIANAITAAQ